MSHGIAEPKRQVCQAAAPRRADPGDRPARD